MLSSATVCLDWLLCPSGSLRQVYISCLPSCLASVTHVWTTTQAAGLWHRSLSLQCTCRCRLGTSYKQLAHKLVKVASSHQLLLLVFSASCPHVGRGAGKNTITAVTAVLIRNWVWFCKSSIEKARKLKTFSINVHSHENTVLLTSRLWSREEKTPGN